MSGYSLWEKDARPLASLASIILQLGLPLTDISPLPQILSLALYSLSSVYLGKIFKVNSSVLLSLVGIIFVLNPYNLQNFSYIFDSFTMGLSVFSSISAFLLVSIFFEYCLSNIQKVLVCFLSVFLLISSLCLYQPSTSIYIATLAFYSLIELTENSSIRKSLNIFIFSIGILFFSLLAYLPIKNYYIFNQATYGLDKKTSTAPLKDLLNTFISNLLQTIQYIRFSLGNGLLRQSIINVNPLLLIYILGILVFCCLFFITLNKFNQSQSNTIKFKKLFIIIILSLFYCFLIIVSFSGIGLILLKLSSQPRIFMGFSAAVAISCFFLAYFFDFSKFLRYFLIFFLSLLCLSFINISLTLGNVIHHQNTQETMIATILVSDLEEEVIKLSEPIKDPKIIIAGGLEPSLHYSRRF